MVGGVAKHSDDMKAMPASDPKVGQWIDSYVLIAQEDRANNSEPVLWWASRSPWCAFPSTISIQRSISKNGFPRV